MFQGNKLSSDLQQSNQANTEVLKEFYSLHYPAKKKSSPEHQKVRSNSVMAVSEHYNPEIDTEKESINCRQSKAEKVLHSQHNPSKPKSHRAKQQKQQPFSFKRMLSAKEERGFPYKYFTNCPPKYLCSLDELSNRNTNIKNAVQRCKDQKLKISKVLISQKQSEETKMDYLQLKKKEIEDEKKTQIKAIYQQFFKKQYEELYGDNAFTQFHARINDSVALFRNKIFSK